MEEEEEETSRKIQHSQPSRKGRTSIHQQSGGKLGDDACTNHQLPELQSLVRARQQSLGAITGNVHHCGASLWP